MEAKPYYDAEGFLKLQKTISSAGDAVTTFLARSRESGHVDSKTYGQIASATGDRFAANANGYGNVDIFLQKYDVNNEYLQAMTRLKTLKDRMTTLEEVMEKTRLMWDEAVKKADSRVGNIQNMKEIYGIAGFGVAWEAGKKRDYSDSRAYQFSLYSEKPFPDAYNDWAVWEKSGDYKWAMMFKGTSEISNADVWYQWATGNCDYYAEMLLEESMLGVMKTLPGYDGVDKAIAQMDWDALGEQMNIPEFGEKIEILKKLLSEGKRDEEEIKKYLKTMKKLLKAHPEAYKFIEILFKEADSIVGGISSGLDALEAIQAYTNLGTEMLFHMLSNHEMQIKYLDTLQDAMLQQGFSHGLVVKKIADLKCWYEDTEAGAWNEASKFVRGKLVGKTAGMWDIIPGLKGARKVTGFASNVAKKAEGESISAVTKMMGYKQFDGVLTQTYEKYIILMQEGLASKADVEKADQIFELLRATKIQEYKTMMEIYKDNDAMWGEASVKLNELENMAADHRILNK